MRDTKTRTGEKSFKKGSQINSFEVIVKGETKFD